MTSATAASDYLKLSLAECDREEFHVLYLNHQHQLLAHQRHSIGTLAAASVYPREVVKDAMRHNAGAVILAHNHPSGSPEPSGADRAITRKLQDALGLVDVRVLDHVIICGDGVTSYSFAEHGDI